MGLLAHHYPHFSKEIDRSCRWRSARSCAILADTTNNTIKAMILEKTVSLDENQSYSLEDANRALMELKHGSVHGAKVLLIEGDSFNRNDCRKHDHLQ